jgi:hypothetical protein
MNSTNLALVISIPVTAFLTGLVFAIGGEKLCDAFLSLARYVLLPVIPFWFWCHHVGSLPGHPMHLDGQRVTCNREWDGEWMGVCTGDSKRVAFTPLMFTPIWLVRSIAWVFGREIKLARLAAPEYGDIVVGLKVAPNLYLAHRRKQDVEYMRHNGFYPVVRLDTGVPDADA